MCFLLYLILFLEIYFMLDFYSEVLLKFLKNIVKNR